ncbi:MAG: phosphoribosylamine--glycine ligase [Spirochaetaceae bacterium]|nr:MAG: phosphoribosylamine--glycine ligase [Spirochaetaceae bacterium]
MLKTLVIGSGGREHALARRLADSESVSSVTVLPGNAGIARDPCCTVRGIGAAESALTAGELRSLVAEEQPDLVLVGPTEPLRAGLADDLRSDGFAVVGPSRSVALTGGSKASAKALMERYGIPTPAYRDSTSLDEALRLIEDFQTPMLIKADGPARGTGVTLCHSREGAEIAIDGALRQRRFGSAGDRIVIEQFVPGIAASVTVLLDSSAYLILPSVLDHPQVGEGGTGPNTIGMGSIVPNPAVTDEVGRRIESRIIRPSVEAFREAAGDEGYRGVLHCVFILNEEGPSLLSYKVRFGDPEIQAILPLLEGDFGLLMHGLARNNLADAIGESRFAIRSGTTCAVVAIAAGYPGPFARGKTVTDAGGGGDNLYYHAVEIAPSGEELVTAGGRVLTVTGTGSTLTAARRAAYARLMQVSFEDMAFRRDIGGESVMEQVIEEESVFLPQFGKRGGILPVAVQDAKTGDILMMASVNAEALRRTVETGLATFWSTSRREIWTKGMTSGDTLSVEEIRVDCDQDALLFLVTMNGTGVCHTRNEAGNEAGDHRRRCFYRRLTPDGLLELDL